LQELAKTLTENTTTMANVTANNITLNNVTILSYYDDPVTEFWQ